ncbi:hypothetical protein M0802_007939 [Mischocyttarus mexicanus]|nr:hypothetical protein M0802_007939 [Mischocyttarus mexicanus]
MSPETYKLNHEKFIIYYDFYNAPFGRCIIGLTDTDKAILHFAFVVKDDANAVKDLENEWPLSQVMQDSTDVISNVMKDIFPLKCNEKDTKSILVLIKGTAFQIEVWKALVSIPIHETASYEEVANKINNPKAVRAVASAIGKNRVAYLIPCHRVMGKNGSNKYSCGLKYKQSILLYESKIL